MKKDKFVLLILVLILAVIGATQVAYSVYKYPSSKYLPMYVKVVAEPHIGLNTRTDGLYFGTIPRGDSGRRFMNITNSHNTPVEVEITLKGDLAGWVYPSRNYFVLQPGETSQINVDVVIPNAAPTGDYSGQMYIVMKRT